jgi:PhzF family phenazine biosynthesis protein
VSAPYLQYDVFTGEPLAGNQLAVFLDGRPFDTGRMQAVAREMNFSESTFILPPEAASMSRLRSARDRSSKSRSAARRCSWHAASCSYNPLP